MTLKTLASALATLALAVAAPAASASQRHAAPTGSGTSCSSAAPCSIDQAFSGAAAGDEIILAAGDYGSEAAPLTTRWDDTHGAIDVHGAPGARPHIYSATPGGAIELDYADSRIAYVDLDFYQSDAPALWGNQVSIDHVRIRSTGSGVTINNGTHNEVSVTNTEIHATGEGGHALYMGDIQSAPAHGMLLTLRNDTIIQQGAGWAIGLDITGFGIAAAQVHTEVHVLNSIIRGDYSDVQAVPDEAGDTVAITLDHSNFVTTSKLGSGNATITPNDQNGNQSSMPLFADFAAGDLRQVAGSPTIDAGAADPLAAAADNDNDGRVLGASIDIGADEFAPPAPPSTGDGQGTRSTGEVTPPPTGQGDSTPTPQTTPNPQPTPNTAAARCVVPKLTGKTLEAARAALARAGCKPGKLTKKHSRAKGGKVLKQGKRPGTRVAKGTKIALVVGRR